MRLFFAAFPDDESRRGLSASVRTLELPQASIYPAEKYHMTLLFMGEVPDSRVADVRAIGKTQRVEAITLRFGRWEYWPAARAVVASASDCPEPLTRLRRAITAGLAQRGVGFDDKPLRPHITVARKLVQAPVLPKLSEFSLLLQAFSLVASVTASAGSIYTVVDSWPLLDTAPRC